MLQQRTTYDVTLMYFTFVFAMQVRVVDVGDGKVVSGVNTIARGVLPLTQAAMAMLQTGGKAAKPTSVNVGCGLGGPAADATCLSQMCYPHAVGRPHTTQLHAASYGRCRCYDCVLPRRTLRMPLVALPVCTFPYMLPVCTTVGIAFHAAPHLSFASNNICSLSPWHPYLTVLLLATKIVPQVQLEYNGLPAGHMEVEMLIEVEVRPSLEHSAPRTLMQRLSMAPAIMKASMTRSSSQNRGGVVERSPSFKAPPSGEL